MKKKLSDYLHFYLNGTKVLYALLPSGERVSITGMIRNDAIWYVNYLVQDSNSTRNGQADFITIDCIRPILRLMSDRNQEEAVRWNTGANSYQSYALRIKFFTDRYLDVFSLIKDGLAVDSATIVNF